MKNPGRSLIASAGSALRGASLALLLGTPLGCGRIPREAPAHRPEATQRPSVEGMIQQLRDPTHGDAWTASYRLSGMGQAALPDLVKALNDQHPAVRGMTARILGEMKPVAEDVVSGLACRLRLELQGPNAVYWHRQPWYKTQPARVSVDLAEALGSIGAAAGDAAPTLRDALREGDLSLRRASARALGRIGPVGRFSEMVLPALTRALLDQHELVRVAAADALGDIGQGAKNALTSLVAALGDESTYVRTQSASALGRMGEAARDALPPIEKMMLHDEDLAARVAAAEALVRISPSAKRMVVPVLVDLLKRSTDTCARASAVCALGRIGPEAEEAVRTLEKLILSRDTGGFESDVVEALKRIRGKPEQREQ